MVKNLLNLFFPRQCLGCEEFLEDNEKIICTNCRHDLPLTNFHFENDPTVKNILFGRIELENATALLHFRKKSIVQNLIHNLKYRGNQEIGTFFGKWLGSELAELGWQDEINMVIPVPLHKSRLQERGYNQVTKFGMEISQSLGVNFEDKILLRQFATKTQVFKGRIGRSDLSEAKFVVSDSDKIQGKHLLLVDDLITTGATIEGCANSLLKTNGVKLSLATIAITD